MGSTIAAGQSKSRSADDAPGSEADGRRARGERNREAVIDAILSLIADGHDRPSAAEVAERADVSLRSVFRHFDDLESLHAAAVARHAEQIAPLLHLDIVDGPLHERVASLARQRARLYEAISPMRRVALRLEKRSESIHEGLGLTRRVLHRQLRDLFALELDPMSPVASREVLAALDAMTSWAAWDNLRSDQGLSVNRAVAVVERTVSALLTDAPKSGR